MRYESANEDFCNNYWNYYSYFYKNIKIHLITDHSIKQRTSKFFQNAIRDVYTILLAHISKKSQYL